MAIKQAYQEYLSHFKKTVTVGDFAQSTSENQICLRHDVDHDIDIALEMAFWEFQSGIRSTYFVLPGIAYWDDDPRFLDKCLQIQDFGHEIGLHVNSVADWFLGRTDDPIASIAQDLNKLRSAGLNVTGIAAHGDRACYENNFINYWLFKELKPDAPNRVEHNLTAEGIPAPNSARSVSYNHDDGKIIRSDGEKLNLWACSMEELGLSYHATHLKYDAYYTDSGGGWLDSGDPLGKPLSMGRHQVSMHPVHWKDDKEVYFFLSTARASSKWLATICNEASSIEARHEHILNFTYQDGKYNDSHSTGLGYVELADNPEFINSRLNDARDWISKIPKRDYGEVNVYLERHVTSLRALFPNATYVYLSRKPEDIITSIMNRNWFDTEDDDRHPPVIGLDNWAQLSPFERCCHYVKDVSSRLSAACDVQFQSETITSSPDELEKSLQAIGIAFYPRLAKSVFETRINANKTKNYPAFKDWPKNHRHQFSTIFGHYTNLKSGFSRLALHPYIYEAISLLPDWVKYFKHKIIDIDDFQNAGVFTKNVRFDHDMICIDQLDERHESVRLRQPRGVDYDHSEFEVSLNMTFEAEDKGLAQIFLLGFDDGNNQVEKRLLARMRAGEMIKQLKFRAGFSTHQINFLIQTPSDRGKSCLNVTQFDVYERVNLAHFPAFARRYLTNLAHEKPPVIKD